MIVIVSVVWSHHCATRSPTAERFSAIYVLRHRIVFATTDIVLVSTHNFR
jgi:hypothetical protein